MSSEIKSTTVQTNSLKDKTGTRVLASDSGSAWSWGANVPKGSVIEQFCSPCDGSSITVQSGTYTVQDVTSVMNLTSTYADLTGSTISYTPPTGTQTVIYDFIVYQDYADNNNVAHNKLFLDSDEVVYFRKSTGSSTHAHMPLYFRWAFNIGGSANTNTGRVASWTSAKTIKMQSREYSSSMESKFHQTSYWDGTGGTHLSQPLIGITALT